MSNYHFKVQGDRYNPALSRADIAAILRKELKAMFPRHTFSVRKSTRGQSIFVTASGKGLLTDDAQMTELGVELRKQVTTFCNRWNFDDSDPNSDYCHVNLYLQVEIDERFSRDDISAEADRLKRDYWITNMVTLRETIYGLDAPSPLTRKAFARLQAEFKPKNRKPERNHTVTTEFLKWVEKVKVWINNPAVKYDRGPKFWRVYLVNQILCFVDGTDGMIYKGSYRAPQKESPRGTIFDGLNPFIKGRLLQKQEFDWMVRFSALVGRRFASFDHAWAYAKAQRKLQSVLGREPTPEEIRQEAAGMDGSSYPVLAACNHVGEPVWL